MNKFLKQMGIFFTLIFMTVSFAAPIFAREGEYNATLYHFNCEGEVVSDEEFKEENKKVDEFITDNEFDLVTFVVPEEKYEKYGFDYYLTAVYERNEFGYGVNNDGIVLGMDSDNERFLIETVGRGNEIFGKEEMESLYQSVKEGYEADGYLGAQQAFRETSDEIVSASSIKKSAFEEDYGNGYKTQVSLLTGNENIVTEKQETTIQKPDWYVEDASSFKDFHNDSSVSRVIDNADILTDEEEKEIKKTIKEIWDTRNQDVVVYTDTTSYGMDNEKFSQDFYVYNGYGYGDTYDGLILFVNMDPDNREMVTSACGNTKEKFTSFISNSLDDILYNQFSNQNYGQGIKEWLVGVDEMLQYGALNAPQWYKDYVDGKSSSKQSKVVDETGNLDQGTKQDFEKELKELKEKYGYDFAIYVTDKACEFSDSTSDKDRIDKFAETYYQVSGYDQDCVLLVILTQDRDFMNSDNDYYVGVYTHGSASDKFSSDILSRLEDLTTSDYDNENLAGTIQTYFEYLNQFLETGRLPHDWFTRILWACACLFAGILAGSISLAGAKRKMRTVKKATGASNEMVESSFRVNSSQDIYETTTVSKVYSPRNKDNNRSSGGGSSHRSSYSSSSSSSSGRSFSSSRRSF